MHLGAYLQNNVQLADIAKCPHCGKLFQAARNVDKFKELNNEIKHNYKLSKKSIPLELLTSLAELEAKPTYSFCLRCHALTCGSIHCNVCQKNN